MNDKNLLKEIKTRVYNTKIFDTHEHLLPEEIRRKNKLDFFLFFLHYTSSDLLSSGMIQQDIEYIQEPDNDIEKKWKLFEPHWDNIKNTMYSKNVILLLKNQLLIQTK